MTKSTICKPIIEDISNISKFDESSFGFDMQPLAFSGEYSRYAWCDAVGVAAATLKNETSSKTLNMHAVEGQGTC